MFCVTTVQTAFHDALLPDEDVDVKHYVLAYQELCKFCSRLGTLFGFVVNDLQDKIGRLNQLLGEDEPHYATVRGMIGHEKPDGPPWRGDSGCVTLLRLHRGLEFIILFMSKLVELQPTESTKHAAQEAYNKTLAKHHSWLIRNGARLAMNILPCQKTLCHQTVGDASVEETLDTMLKMISEASMVHNRVNTLFLDNDILNLP